MSRLSPHFGRFAALLMALSLAGVGAARGQEGRGPMFDPSRLKWSELSYRASKLGLTATSDLEVSTLPAAAVTTMLAEPSEGEPIDARGQSTLQIELVSSMIKRENTLRMFLDPGDAAALQRSELQLARKEKNNRFRRLRYTLRGVDSLTRRPAAGEAEEPHERWSDSSQWYSSFPDSLVDGTRPTEPTALLYVMGVAELASPGDRTEALVFTRGHVMEVEVSVAGRETVRVDYEEVSPAGARRVEGRVEALELFLDGQPLDPQTAERDFEFLGMRGDVRVYLDPETRAPLQVSGRIKHAGKANVKLRRVVLR